MLSYSLRDLLRNGRRTLASVVGVALGVGLFASITLFVDGSAATMTERAIAPMPLDMAVEMTSPLASHISLKESVGGATTLAGGQRVTVTLTATNESDRTLTGVLIKDEVAPPLAYVPGTTTLNGVAVPDPEEESPLIVSGLQAGSLAPKAIVTVTYVAVASSAVGLTAGLPFRATAVSREYPLPATANGPQPLRAQDLGAAVSRIQGISMVDRIDTVDLPAGSVRSGAVTLGRPLRVFAFDPVYLTHYPRILITAGRFAPGTALVSVEAARALAAAPGSRIELTVPGGQQPIPIPVGGVTDLSQASSLYSSRVPDTLGDFIYVPNAVVVPLDLFEDLVLTALRLDAARPVPVLKNLPAIELDVKIDRSQLNANPAAALVRTQGLRRSIERIAPGQTFVIDNLSNALTVARGDAVVAKVLFLFLGLPGVLLAAFLSGYAGSLLAQAQRREIAILRGRGAHARHLMRLLAYKTVAIAILGSLIGLGCGLLAILATVGRGQLLTAAPVDLVQSAAVAVGAGLVATAIGLYIPGRRSLRREVSEERREIELGRPPLWLRFRLDLVLLALAAVVETVTFLAGGFTPLQTEGQALSLSFYVLLAPMLAWFGATLFGVRLAMFTTPRIPNTRGGRFGRLVGGTLRRSLKRRSRGLATGIAAVGLALGFGTSVAIFVATYHAEKAADARFAVGSDIRVTPSVLTPQPASFASQLLVPGAASATPVSFHIGNAALGTDKKDLAAVDVPSLERTAPLSDSFFTGISAARAMAALKNDPAAVLVDWEAARDYNITVGDPLKVQLIDSAGREVPVTLHVVGRTISFPGFPFHIDLVANLAFYQSATGRPTVDFFYVRTIDPGAATVAKVTDAIRSGPGQATPLFIDTTANAASRDQSTLAALNLNGLGRLDSLYTALMSAAAIAIFVFGLMLQRRKEYVTMRALGIRMRQLQALVLGEAALVAAVGLLIGSLVGAGMAFMFVQVLRPVFTLPPDRLTLPAVQLGALAGLVLGGMAVSALIATGILRRLKPMELLREE